jgi:bacterioferritin
MSQAVTLELQELVDELSHSYWMELETVQDDLANATNLVGVRAQQIKNSLAADVTEELGHAKRLAERIHTIGGQIPGSLEFQPEQETLQPPQNPADVVAVIRGVIEAETRAIEQYNKLVRMCDGVDFVTQDLCIALLADEEAHRREFYEYLAEYEK